MILGRNTSLVPIDLVVNVGAAELELNITCGAVRRVLTVRFIAVAVPVKAGLAKGAFKFNSASFVVLVVFKASWASTYVVAAFVANSASFVVLVVFKANCVSTYVVDAFVANSASFVVLVVFKASCVSTYVVAAFAANAVSFVVLSVFNANCAVVAVETGLLASLVLSTLVSPTVVLDSPPTVPVKVGLLIGALAANAFVIVVA